MPSARIDDRSTWTPAQWIAWRDAEIDSLLRSASGSANGGAIDRIRLSETAAEDDRVVEAKVAEDPHFLDPRSATGSALGNFAAFVKAAHWEAVRDPNGAHIHALGFAATDKEYWQRAATYLAFPAPLNSQAFLNLLENPGTYRRAARQIEALNAVLPEDRKWIVLIYRSRFILSADRKSYGRILIVIPNERAADGEILDRWIQFAVELPGEADSQSSQSVSMVAVLRNAARPGTSRAFLADFLRQRQADGDIRLAPTMERSNNPSTNCYNCHKGAVIPIHPKSEYSFESDGSLVERATSDVPSAVNERMAGYGRTDFGFFEPRDYGPTIGAADRTRRALDFRDDLAIAGLDSESIERVSAAMKCGKCHDRSAPINFPLAVRTLGDATAFESKVGLVQSYVESGWMPPNNALSPPERRALWQSLMREYFDPKTKSGTFVTWLKGGSG